MSNSQQLADLYAKKPLQPLYRLGSLLCILVMTALPQTPAQAQTLYRSVGPDGRVTFSDQPPAAAAKVTPLNADGMASGASNATLPYELRQVAGKYPVTLFTSAECAPCDEGRTLLRSRGIPFAEKTVTTNDDAESLKRLADTTSLPLLIIGGQHIKGYSAPEWTQYLNAAGYPPKSVLPANYRYTAPSPLVASKPTAEAPAPARARDATTPAPASPAPSSRVSPNNPAGIQF